MSIFKKLCSNFSKEDIKVDSFLPHKIRLNNYLNIDSIIFSAIDSESYFSCEDSEYMVEAIGKYVIGNCKVSNIYLKSLNKEAKLILEFDDSGKTVENIKFFYVHETIYPQSSEEWKSWLGSSESQGLIGDRDFIITEPIQDKLFRCIKSVVRKSFPSFESYNEINIGLDNSKLYTNLAEILSDHTNLEISKIAKVINKELIRSQWILNATLLSDNDIELEFDHSYFHNTENLDSQLLYENYYDVNGPIELTERIYNQNINKENFLKVKKSIAIYEKTLNNSFTDKEYIYISSYESDSESYIKIYLGIDLFMEDLD